MEDRVLAVLLFALTFNLIITATQQQQNDNRQKVSFADQGSGYSSGDDGDDEDRDDAFTVSATTTAHEGSGGDAFDEEIKVEARTPCERQRAAALKNGAFSPECTFDGQFKMVQCNSKKCWCVNKDGIKQSGTDTKLPEKPSCSGKNSGKPKDKNKDVISVVTRSPVAALPDITDDIVIDEPATPWPMDFDKTTGHKTTKVQSTTVHDDSDVDVEAQRPPFFSFFLKDPLIFAAIIGGAVLALLCIVLLVMFTIYRMRKKDEGSYALEEPKKSHGFAYTRARDKEFFA